MKLLLDQNLSPRLVKSIQDLYPGSVHVREIGLAEAPDEAIWRYAATHGFAIVSKDWDFCQRSLFFGHPPKVVWIAAGNASTAQIDTILRNRAAEIVAFGRALDGALLVLE